MKPLSPADEMAMIRADLAKLKLREQALRQTLLDAPKEALNGEWAQAEIVERQIRVFDHRLLPSELRDDPLYWRERSVTEIRCTTHASDMPENWTHLAQATLGARDAAESAQGAKGEVHHLGPRPVPRALGMS